MRKLFLFITITLCAAYVRAQDVVMPPTAVLMVHFGTTYDDTRAKTIDAINAKVKKEFPGYKDYMDPLTLSVACHNGPGSIAVS